MRLCSHLSTVVLFSLLALSQEPIQTNSAASESLSTRAVSVPITLAPDASGTVSQEQIRELLRYAQDREVENEKRLRDYTYIEREEEHTLDGNGQIKKVEIRTREVLNIYGETIERLIAKDDKPLSAEEAKKEEERIQKITDKRKNESDGDRRKRLEKEEKDRIEARKFVLEVADAFNFRLISSEEIDGRDTWVIDGEPRPGYQPKERSTKMLSKFKGRMWIDKAEGQWMKMNITSIDTVSIGLLIARLHKGARIVAQQTKINDEVWLPKHLAVQADVRLALVKNYNEDIDMTFRDYKKFRTDSKITAVGETQ
jgi:hypothetical protein